MPPELDAPITAVYAALLALFVVGLGVRITYLRQRLHKPLGDGGDSGLERAMRAHGNAIENVPLVVLLMLLLEINGGSGWLLHIAGTVTIAARAIHAWGIIRPYTGTAAYRAATLTGWTVIALLAFANLEVKTMRRDHPQNILALIYDFDGTLTPQPMQEYTVLPELGIAPDEFWSEVGKQIRATGGDQILTYMRLLIEKIEANKKHLSRDALRKLAEDIRYFPGVESWFERVNRYVQARSAGAVAVRHYIISAGLAEILAGVSIRGHFERIYASQYFFDHHEVARFPTIAINDTGKTQYLFRINKGREEALESINDYMPEKDRPIPFEHMLYIGDGMTDVPCMTVTKRYGGFAIAVHKPRDRKSIKTCQELAQANRIDYFAPADYREGKVLEKRVRPILDLIIARIQFETERARFRTELKR